MEKRIEFQQAWELPNVLFVDVRSPKEYEEDHIPGAINLPVLEDDERHDTGLTYHQVSDKEARHLGLEVIAPKLPRLMRTIEEYAQRYKVVLYCWRGGMRSASLAAVADVMRIPVYRLNKGYKAYRAYVNQYFRGLPPFRFYVLCGNTGVGKTETLQALDGLGIQTLDLEGCANHRGSAFGGVGLGQQPSQKAFDSAVWHRLNGFDTTKPVVLECESRRIGRLLLPELLYQGVVRATPILLYDSIPGRVARILADYQPERQPDQVAQALACISPKLGKKKTENLLNAVAAKEFGLITETLLTDYYDQLYHYPNGPAAQYPLCVDVAAGSGAQAIQVFLQQQEE